MSGYILDKLATQARRRRDACWACLAVVWLAAVFTLPYIAEWR
jgi:hypothetical protein